MHGLKLTDVCDMDPYHVKLNYFRMCELSHAVYVIQKAMSMLYILKWWGIMYDQNMSVSGLF